MPATSKAQQRFFAMCEHDPQHAQGKCPNMSQEKMHEYAATPLGGLPNRVPRNKLKSRMMQNG